MYSDVGYGFVISRIQPANCPSTILFGIKTMAETPPVTMRLKSEVAEQLRQIAEDEERSISWVVNKFLAQALDDYAGGLPPKPSKK